MINKKGILLGNTLKTILAVLILVMLFIGTWMVFRAVTQDAELEKISKLTDRIEAKIAALSQNESTTLTIQSFDPVETWYIVGWGLQDPGAPEKCSLSSCVCICSGGFNDQTCQARSKCIDIEETNVNISSIDSVEKSTLSDKGEITFDVNDRVNYIKIPQNFIEISIEKGTDSQGNTFLQIQDG